MKIFYMIAFMLIVISATPEEDWQAFKVKYKKHYKNILEEEKRKKIFFENCRGIKEHQILHEEGKVAFSLKMNQFGDLKLEEFSALVNGFRAEESMNNTVYNLKNDTLPRKIDWKRKGAVTPVNNQGSCSACWAFSATGSLEAQQFLKSKKLVFLSEQNLIDCSGRYGNKGCKGGSINQAFQYVKDNNGINSEEFYHYEGKDGLCRYKPTKVAVKCTEYINIPYGDEAQLQSAVANIGPISAAVDANHFTFQFYHSGIYYEPACSSEQVNHAVLVTGYSCIEGTEYWILKNSWGTSWGIRGYMQLIRNKNNQCGIASMASYPVI